MNLSNFPNHFNAATCQELAAHLNVGVFFGRDRVELMVGIWTHLGPFHLLLGLERVGGALGPERREDFFFLVFPSRTNWALPDMGSVEFIVLKK